MSLYCFLLLLQGIGVVLSLLFTCFMARRKSFLNNKYLLLTMISSFIQVSAICFEFLSVNAEVALLAIKIQFIGSCFSTMTMFYFILELFEIKIPKSFYISGIIINSFILIGVFCLEYHNLFFISYIYDSENTFYHHIIYNKGILLYLFIAVRFLFAAFMLYKIILKFIKCEKEEKKKNFFMLVSIFIPSFFIFVEALFSPKVPDFTALGFIISSVFFAIIIYKYRVFDLVQSAKEIIIQNMVEAMIFVDQNFLYIESNLSAKNVFPRLKYMKKGDKISRCSIILSEMLKKDGRNDFEIKGKFYECHVSKIYNDGIIKGYAACIFDVTSAHYYAEQLIRMKDEADAANRAKSDFLANASHEIRTPMNAIIGLSEIVLRGELNEDQRGNIRSILTSSKSLLTIINNILDLSKIESGKFEIIDEDYNIGNVLHDVYNIINVRLYDRPIEFDVDIPDDLPAVYNGDFIRIKEILFNILGNAVKFTKEGQIKLNIEWKINEKDDQFVNLTMKVSDTGIGIKKEDMKKLFETYNQVDTRKNRSISGTGLGLAISKNLAEMMGGFISVESVYGKGSVFTIGIKQKVVNFDPVDKEVIFKDDEDEFTEEKNGCLNEKIISIPYARVLIVDDLNVNLRVSKGLMEPYDMKVDVASNGMEAIKMIKEKDYDLVFMDHMMPNMDGVDVTKIIRSLDGEKYKKLPIIALTANALTSSRDYFMKNGFNGFLAKPIDLKQLNKVLYDYLPIRNDIKEQTEESVKTDNFAIKIKGIDSSVILKNVNGKVEAYYKILKSYTRETKIMYSQFDELIENDLDTFRIKIHGLKSSSANIGAVFISEKARLLEMAANDYDTEYIKNNKDAFYKKLEELLSNIEKFILQYEEENKKDSQEIFTTLDNNLLLTIKKAAGDFDISAMETAMAEINKKSYTNEINEFIESLDIHIENFEYDKCIELINGYIK